MKKRQRIRKGIIMMSFFLFPATYYYFSPALIMMAGSKGIVNGSFIIFSLLLVSAVFLGRAFCGWVCPGAGCQESLIPARDRQVSRGNYIKWIIWFPWITGIVLLAVKSGGYREIDFFYKTKYGMSISDLPGLVTYLLVLIPVIVMPALLFGKRSFCHHLCWMAPFMMIGRKAGNLLQTSLLHLKPDAPKCRNCHTCTENCPMSLPVEEMVRRMKTENSECILCGTCVDGCKQGALNFHWGRVMPAQPADADRSSE
jgi:polyferredoxin